MEIESDSWLIGDEVLTDGHMMIIHSDYNFCLYLFVLSPKSKSFSYSCHCCFKQMRIDLFGSVTVFIGRRLSLLIQVEIAYLHIN